RNGQPLLPFGLTLLAGRLSLLAPEGGPVVMDHGIRRRMLPQLREQVVLQRGRNRCCRAQGQTDATHGKRPCRLIRLLYKFGLQAERWANDEGCQTQDYAAKHKRPRGDKGSFFNDFMSGASDVLSRGNNGVIRYSCDEWRMTPVVLSP